MNPHTRKLDYCSTMQTIDSTVVNKKCKTIKVTNGALADNGDGTYTLTTGADGGGDVSGPGASTDNALVRFDGTTGKIIQDYTSGTPTCSDTGACTFALDVTVPDEAYDATNWDSSLEVPTKNAVRDKIESMGSGSGDHGGLSGLGDDDHPQYGQLADAETITGNWVNTANPWAANELISTVVIEGDADSIDSAMYVDGSIDEEHLADDAVKYHLRFNLPQPKDYYDNVDHEALLWRQTDAAITITSIKCSLDADPTTELAFDLKWSDAFIGFANAAVIDVCDTTSGTTSITSGFDDATVASGKDIYLLLDATPDADITQLGCDISYTYD